MDFLYEKAVRPWLFRLDSENAHERGVEAMALLGRLTPVCRLLESWARLPAARFRPVQAFGLTFPNAVGLAAGFDKNARAWPAAAASGNARCIASRSWFSRDWAMRSMEMRGRSSDHPSPRE